MKLYKCDRCGELIYKGEDVYNVDYRPNIYHSWEVNDCERNFDLCPTCYASLVDWFELKKE